MRCFRFQRSRSSLALLASLLAVLSSLTLMLFIRPSLRQFPARLHRFPINQRSRSSGGNGWNRFRLLKGSSSETKASITRDVFDPSQREIMKAMGLVESQVEEDVPETNGTESKNIIGDLHEEQIENLCQAYISSLQKPLLKVALMFCDQLKALARAIVAGREDPLATMYTWLPDALVDAERYSRKSMILNWSLLRPVLRIVIFSDARSIMAQANVLDVTCLSVPEQEEDGAPVLRNMSEVVMERYPSTFYVYVQATTVFDPSLLATLLHLKDRYLTSEETTTGNGKPIVGYGRSVVMLQNEVESLVNYEQFFKTASAQFKLQRNELKEVFYLVYRGPIFKHLPAFTAGNNKIISFAVEQAALYGNIVVDLSETVLTMHTYKNRTKNEWGREVLHAKPFNSDYNKQLIEEFAMKNRNNVKLAPIFRTRYNDGEGMELVRIK